MAIQVNRQIVTDKLVACYDAASPRSYTGASPWIDLSRTSTNATGEFPNYSSLNNGFFEFNTTKSLYFVTPNLGNSITVEMWCKLTGAYQDKIPFGFLKYCVYIPASGSMGFNTGNGENYGVGPAIVTNVLSGKWCQWTMVMRSDVSYTNNKFYINTTGQTLSANNGSAEFPTDRNFNGGSGRISSTRNSDIYRCPMQCAIFRIYNKELTLAEIQQNFEANRTRFGL